MSSLAMGSHWLGAYPKAAVVATLPALLPKALRRGGCEGGTVRTAQPCMAAWLRAQNRRIIQVGKDLSDHEVQPSPQPHHAC